jgi:large subunit ribosomal protein L5
MQILDLKSLYKKKIRGQCADHFHYKNTEQIPKVRAIHVNRGIFSKSAKELESNLQELTLITGQKPVISKAKKSVAGFKIRAGMPVGIFVTLRNDKMYDFLTRLIHIVLPRVSDFKGLNKTSFDGSGNYSFGISDQLVFPEISYVDVLKMRGFDITIETTARTDHEAEFMLRSFGLRFTKFYSYFSASFFDF